MPVSAIRWCFIDEDINAVSKELEAIARSRDDCRRLLTIPGVGPLVATALVASVGNGRHFKRGRELAAWLGLVPREHSTGGKQRLLGISKRGSSYLRKLMIHGARSCYLNMNREPHRMGQWIDQLSQRGAHREREGPDGLDRGGPLGPFVGTDIGEHVQLEYDLPQIAQWVV